MGNHKIVWFDDEHDSLEGIISTFGDHNIDVKGFRSAEDGNDYLEKHYKNIDAIVIDGHFFTNSRDQNIDKDGFALNSVLKVLNAIKAKHKQDIPYFILSGQQVLTKGSSPAIKTLGINKVFDKLKDEDITDLCKDIVNASEASISRQIEYKYSDLMALAQPEFLGPETFERISDFLTDIETEDLQISFTERLNAMRKIFEAIYTSLVKHHMTPENLSLNEFVRFLHGDHHDFELKMEIMPKTLAYSTKYVIDITQDCSHDKSIESLRLQSDGFFKDATSVYAYKGIVFTFIQILHWYENFIEQCKSLNINSVYQRKNSNKNTDDWIEGRIESISENGWAQFASPATSTKVGIPKGMALKYRLTQGQKLYITTKKDVDSGKLLVDQIRSICHN